MGAIRVACLPLKASMSVCATGFARVPWKRQGHGLFVIGDTETRRNRGGTLRTERSGVMGVVMKPRSPGIA